MIERFLDRYPGYRTGEISKKKYLDPYSIIKHPVFYRKSYVRRIVATSTILYELNIADASAQKVGTFSNDAEES